MPQIPGQDDSPTTIVVIGAGVIGLTTAVSLQAKLAGDPDLSETNVMIVAREWPNSLPSAVSGHSPDYASMWAGAHVRPIPDETAQLREEAKWLRHTVAEFSKLAQHEPWCGIKGTKGIELFDDPDDYFGARGIGSMERESGLPGWRTLSSSELPTGVELGFEYDTFCINPPMYCEYLLRRFVRAGGKTMRRDLRSVAEALTLHPRVSLIVNASGVGFVDPNCFITRGSGTVHCDFII